MRKIMISIALVALMLTGCSQKEARTTAVENVATNTIATVGDADTATTEAVVENKEKPAPEKETLEANNAVTTEDLVTTEIGGGKKKEDSVKPSTTETMKPSNSSNSGSGHSSTSGNSSNNSANNGSSNSFGNSGSGGNNSGASTPATTEAPKPATTEAPTTQHQHVYDQVKVDTPAWTETIVHPAEYKTVPAVQCNTCYGVFTSYADFDAHATYGGGSCEANGHGETTYKQKVKEETTEYVEHPAVTHRECKCGARE